jgi:hypothetical protein
LLRQLKRDIAEKKGRGGADASAKAQGYPGTLFGAGSAPLLFRYSGSGYNLALFRADLVADELAFFKTSLGGLSPTFLRQLKRDIIAQTKRRGAEAFDKGTPVQCSEPGPRV